MTSSVSPLLAGKRIVIVEDEPLIRMLIHQILTRAGLLVVGHANSAEEGIPLILRERPDLVTMDITLGGMDGIEATRRVTAVCPTRVVMMSAYSREFCQHLAFGAGACGYIVKPFTTGTVIGELERCSSKCDTVDDFDPAESG